MVFQTLICALPGTQTPTSPFASFNRPGFDYSNDEGPVVSFTVSSQEFRTLLDSVGSLPRVTDGDVDPHGHVSFALLHSSGSTVKVFEAIVNDTTGRQLFGRLISALSGNARAVRLLRDFGCGAVVLPIDTPTNVGSLASVTMTGLRRDRTSQSTYRGRVAIRNTGSTTIASPVYLVIKLKGNATLLAPDGYTCNIAPSGSGFVVVSRGTIAPGATIYQSLRFSNPSEEKFDTSFRVFAGPGTP
jgi:hypothetical protein